MHASDLPVTPAVRTRTATGASRVVMHVMGVPSVQHGACEDYLVSVAVGCREAGLEPVFVYPREPESEAYRRGLAAAGGTVVVLPRTGEPGLACARVLRSAIREFDPGIVHAHFGRVGYLTVFVARGLGRRGVFLTKHQLSDDQPTLQHRALYRAVGRVADGLFCVSPQIKEQLAGFGLAEEKLHVSLMGVDMERYRPNETARAEVRDSLGLGDERPVILCVSHLRPRKGLEVLVEAMATVADRFPEALLLICGEGELRGQLEAQIGMLGLERGVHLLGMRHDIPSVMAAADIFVCPSFSEGCCSSMLEAMAVGLPVVTTPVAYANSLIEEGLSGALAPIGEPQGLAAALSSVLEKPAHWRLMGERARSTLSRDVDMAVEARRIAERYTAVLAGPVVGVTE